MLCINVLLVDALLMTLAMAAVTQAKPRGGRKVSACREVPTRSRHAGKSANRQAQSQASRPVQLAGQVGCHPCPGGETLLRLRSATLASGPA